jgi:hypothetical protein
MNTEESHLSSSHTNQRVPQEPQRFVSQGLGSSLSNLTELRPQERDILSCL